MNIKLLSILLLTALFSASKVGAGDHFDDIKAGKVFFRMQKSILVSAESENCDPVVLGNDNVIHCAEVSGQYIDEAHLGYKIVITFGNHKTKTYYYEMEPRNDSPLRDLFLYRFPSFIKTTPTDPGIEPCFNPRYGFSMWYLQNDKLEKVETALCGGRAPFLTPQNKMDLENLNRLRDIILVLGEMELITK